MLTNDVTYMGATVMVWSHAERKYRTFRVALEGSILGCEGPAKFGVCFIADCEIWRYEVWEKWAGLHLVHAPVRSLHRLHCTSGA